MYVIVALCLYQQRSEHYANFLVFLCVSIPCSLQLRVLETKHSLLVVLLSVSFHFLPYMTERQREISQRLEFHYYVERNRHVDSLLQSRKPGQCFYSPLHSLCFLLQNFLTSTALSKTAGLFLYAYLNHCTGKYRICIYFSSLSFCGVEFSSRRTEGTFKKILLVLFHTHIYLRTLCFSFETF
jgi:hypothetical protein